MVRPNMLRPTMYFNPRSREGSDYIRSITRSITVTISIHAPARGATSDQDRIMDTGDFNPRSREGSDTAEASQSLDQINFNPRSREGSDQAQHSYRG